MTNTQTWLNQNYPQNQRVQIEEINNSSREELQGELIIADFPNLKKINLANSKGITKMTITNCPQVKEVNVSNNQIAELVINEPTNLNNLPLMPQGETLDTLLQRPTREQLEQVKEELNIERDHAQDIDNWYRRLIDGSLGNEVLQLQWESQLKTNLINKLESEIEILEQIAEAEFKDCFRLFTEIQDKKKELKQLKTDAKDKLENELQKNFLKTLLITQEQLIYLENANQQTRLPSEKLLQKAKRNLSSKLNEEEINSLCQLQTEITKLEMELEQIKEDKLEAKIEERQPPRFRN